MHITKKNIHKIGFLIFLWMPFLVSFLSHGQEDTIDSIGLNKTQFTPGEEIVISYRCTERSYPYLWIGLFDANIADNEIINSGFSKKILGNLNGQLLLDAPNREGNYKIILYTKISTEIRIIEYKPFRVKEDILNNKQVPTSKSPDQNSRNNLFSQSTNSSGSKAFPSFSGIYLYPSRIYFGEDSDNPKQSKYAKLEEIILHYEDKQKRPFTNSFQPHIGIIESKSLSRLNPEWLRIAFVPNNGKSIINVNGIDKKGDYIAYLFPNGDMRNLDHSMRHCTFAIKDNYRVTGAENYIIDISKSELLTDEEFSLKLHVEESSFPYLWIVFSDLRRHRLIDNISPSKDRTGICKLNAPSSPGEYMVNLEYCPPNENLIKHKIKSLMNLKLDTKRLICDRRAIKVKLKLPSFKLDSNKTYRPKQKISITFTSFNDDKKKYLDKVPDYYISILQKNTDSPKYFKQDKFISSTPVLRNNQTVEIPPIQTNGHYKALLYPLESEANYFGPLAQTFFEIKGEAPPVFTTSKKIYEQKNGTANVIVIYGDLPKQSQFREISIHRHGEKYKFRTDFLFPPYGFDGRKEYDIGSTGHFDAKLWIDSKLSKSVTFEIKPEEISSTRSLGLVELAIEGGKKIKKIRDQIDKLQKMATRDNIEELFKKGKKKEKEIASIAAEYEKKMDAIAQKKDITIKFKKSDTESLYSIKKVTVYDARWGKRGYPPDLMLEIEFTAKPKRVKGNDHPLWKIFLKFYDKSGNEITAYCLMVNEKMINNGKLSTSYNIFNYAKTAIIDFHDCSFRGIYGRD